MIRIHSEASKSYSILDSLPFQREILNPIENKWTIRNIFW